MTALARVLRRLRRPRVTPAPDWWGPACTCSICVLRDARADLHATLRAEGTRYDTQWPDVIAAEAPPKWADLFGIDPEFPGGDLAAMAAPWPVQDLAPHIAAMHDLAAGMARDDLGTYAEPAKPRGRHRQTDPLDLILADLRDLGGL